MADRQNVMSLALASVLLFVALSQQGCEDIYRCLADLGKFSGMLISKRGSSQ